MKRIVSARRVLAGVAALVVGVTASLFAMNANAASEPGVDQSPTVGSEQAPEAGAESPAWPTNARGLTYGSSLFAESPDDEPDLILAYAEDGQLGYVYRDELNGPMPSSPEEALAQQAAMLAEYPDGRSIPVYEADGLTKIGVFVVTPGIVTTR